MYTYIYVYEYIYIIYTYIYMKGILVWVATNYLNFTETLYFIASEIL